jgi:hypothetical protein
MNSFINAVIQRLDSRNGVNPASNRAWDEDDLELYSEALPDDPNSKSSLFKEWATIFVTLVEVGLIVLTVDHHR